MCWLVSRRGREICKYLCLDGGSTVACTVRMIHPYLFVHMAHIQVCPKKRVFHNR
jgi:hypothetical protein